MMILLFGFAAVISRNINLLQNIYVLYATAFIIIAFFVSFIFFLVGLLRFIGKLGFLLIAIGLSALIGRILVLLLFQK